MKFPWLVRALLLTTPLIACVPAISTAIAGDDPAKAMSEAKTELAAAQKAGHVWRLIDKATGSRAVNLGKLLAAGEKAQAAGDIDEALRIYALVKDAAILGQEQAKSQANAGPTY